MTDVVRATTLRTEAGELALLEHHDVLVAAGFSPVETMWGRLADPPPLRTTGDLGPLSRAVRAYFDGDIHALDTLPVQQPGGAFLQAAWKVMREVPPGETVSYAELAARAGSPAAVRAAGSACSRNLVAVVVPCHRVVRTGGALGGYYYGLETKHLLLEHERRSLTRR